MDGERNGEGEGTRGEVGARKLTGKGGGGRVVVWLVHEAIVEGWRRRSGMVCRKSMTGIGRGTESLLVVRCSGRGSRGSWLGRRGRLGKGGLIVGGSGLGEMLLVLVLMRLRLLLLVRLRCLVMLMLVLGGEGPRVEGSL